MFSNCLVFLLTNGVYDGSYLATFALNRLAYVDSWDFNRRKSGLRYLGLYTDIILYKKIPSAISKW